MRLKWPWVSRDRLEVAEELAEYFKKSAVAKDVDDARARLDAERGRNDELVRHIMSMKREGFDATPIPAHPPAATDPDFPEDVEKAIHQMAPDGGELRRHLTRFANQRLEDPNADDDAIASAILEGENLDEVG